MQIIIAPDSRLNQISRKVEIIDDSIISILDQMLKCMYQNNGIGLAAPQVGILKRLVVIDCSDNKDIKKPLKLINPEITELSKNISEFEEGCLSLPSQYAKVSRPSEITLKYGIDKESPNELELSNFGIKKPDCLFTVGSGWKNLGK